MNARLPRLVLLPTEGLEPLLRTKGELQAEAAGKLPEALIQAVAQAAVRLDRQERLASVLTPEVFALVHSVLRELTGKKWHPPDTLIVLRQRAKKTGGTEHGDDHR